eukprot:SAG25_NODE_922_length_4750_cov_27.067512_3_plen_50_part_00
MTCAPPIPLRLVHVLFAAVQDGEQTLEVASASFASPDHLDALEHGVVVV